MLNFILIFLTASLSFGALTDLDRSEIWPENIISNGGFEGGAAGWVASGGSFAIATSGSNLLMGKGSATWDSSASSQSLTSKNFAITNGLKGRSGAGSCVILTPSGTATHLLQAYDGTNILASTTVFSSTTPTRTSINFRFPTSGNVLLRLISVASNEPSITIDSCYLGPAEGINLILSDKRDVLSAYITNSGTPAVSTQNQNWISSITDNGAGDFTLNFVSGTFTVTPSCTCAVQHTVARFCTINEATAPSASAIRFLTTSVTPTASDEDVHIVCQKQGADAAVLAYNADTSAQSWSGYHDTTCSWARANTAFGDPTADASCALVERTNSNFGTVSTSGSVLPAITFTPKRAGRYYACANVQLNNSALSSTSIRLVSGSTVLGDVATSLQAGNIANMMVCGIHVANNTSAQTISLQTAVSSGTVTVAAAGVATSSIEWSVIAIDNSFPAPVVANGVVSTSNATTKIATAYITNSGTPTVSRQDGSWISSLTDNGTGRTQINIAAGTFSTTPNCVCRSDTNVASICAEDTGTENSTTIQINTKNTAGTNTDADFSVICVGAP